MATQAEANTACFDWVCDPNPWTLTCTFDAGCTQWTSGQLWRYRWDFGDGQGYAFTGDEIIVNYYYSGCYKIVELTVIPLDAEPFSVENCEVLLQNCVGPPLSLQGRCSG
jgi:hypothetical protein